MASKNGVLKLADGRKLELVGVMEAAEIVGVERSRFARWLGPLREWRRDGRRGEMPQLTVPQPIADLACGPVWIRSDMERFAKTFSRRRHQAAATV